MEWGSLSSSNFMSMFQPIATWDKMWKQIGIMKADVWHPEKSAWYHQRGLGCIIKILIEFYSIK